MIQGLPPRPENPCHLTFRDPQWPANQIRADNVLEYFCNPANTFYDITSCNQQVRMQNITRPMEECLREMTGIQFIVWHSSPPLFVICKQRRNSPLNVTPMAYYYVNNGNVHQAPDLFALAQSKLMGALEQINSAFLATSKMVRYTISKGYGWEFKGVGFKFEGGNPIDEGPKAAERYTNFQLTRTQMLLNQLMEEMPPNQALDMEEKPAASTSEPVFAEPRIPARRE